MSREEMLKKTIPITEWNELERKMAIISRMTADREFFPYESSIYGGKPRMTSSMNNLDGMGIKVIRVTPPEEIDAGLQPLEFEIDVTDLDVEIKKFPRPDCYLMIRARSEENQTFMVLAHNLDEDDIDALTQSIRGYFGEAEYVPLRLGDPVEMTISGDRCVARRFTTGRGPSRMLWYAAHDPEHRGVIIVFGKHIRRKDKIAEVDLLDDPVLYQIVNNLKFKAQGE